MLSGGLPPVNFFQREACLGRIIYAIFKVDSCINHHQEIKKALGILEMATSVSTWYCEADKMRDLSGAQIDMIIERADRMIHLCEMKFAKNAYNISAEYEDKLRQRMWLFQLKTKEKRPIVHTFVTTFDLGNGKHRSIVHSEVTMNDLFA